MSLTMIPTSSPIAAALCPPPNTPLTPTFPTSLAPFAPSLSTSQEETSASSALDHDDEETDPHTITSYGLLTPSESYLPPPPPSPSTSPKRYPHGCLRFRSPIRRPPLPKRTSSGMFGDYGYGGYAEWSCPRVVIGGNNSEPASPVTPTLMSRTKPAYPGYLGSPSSSPSASPTSSRASPSSKSPAPLPIRLRPMPLPHSRSLSGPNALPDHLRSTPSDLMSDSETEVEPELDGDREEGDTSASDTCASDSDSEDADADGRCYSGIKGKMRVRAPMLTSKPRAMKVKKPPIPTWDCSVDDEEAEVVVVPP